MTDRHTLPDDLHALLQAERGAETVSPALRANLTRRLSASLGLALSVPPVSPSHPSEGATAIRWLLQKPFVAALVFGAGAAVGSTATLGMQAESRVAAPAVVAIAPPPTAASPVAPEAEPEADPSPGSVSSPAPEPARAVTARPRAARPSNETHLRSERQWVDRARSALERGNAEDALLALAAHQQRYPAGQLAEERASLNVVALVRAGRTAEAERASHGFRSKYPNSLFGAMVERALARSR